jgi:LacI family transcriptional regulator
MTSVLPPPVQIDHSGHKGPAGRSSRRAKLADVAAAARLSITQASRALAGYSDVATATRERVRQIADELGYRPSRRARSLALGPQGTIRCAVVIFGLDPSGFHRSSYSPALPGILARATTERMEVHLAAIDRADPAGSLARFAAEDRADGIILLTFEALQPEYLAPLDDRNLPYVLVNRHFDHLASGPHVPCVTLDWAGVTQNCVTRFVALGHRQFAAIFGDRQTSTLHDRVRGWQEGLARYGLDARSAPIVEYGDTTFDAGEAGYAIGKRLLLDGLPGAAERPTALLGFNDMCALGILRAARELGISVPEQLSVVGIDNSIAPYTFPPLCSYDPHFYEAGERAASMLAALLRGGPVEQAPRVVLPFTFVCRGSCGPAPLQPGSLLQSSGITAQHDARPVDVPAWNGKADTERLNWS